MSFAHDHKKIKHSSICLQGPEQLKYTMQLNPLFRLI